MTQKIAHSSSILDLIEKLSDARQISFLEPSLRQLEICLIKDNISVIVDTAKVNGERLIINPHLSPPETKEEACVQRYIYVPILYKLGFTKEASELAQLTFEYLFPNLHLMILKKLQQIFNNDLTTIEHDALELFSIKDENILRAYARKKSTHSIWKKIENIEKFQSMNLEEFANTFDDFIAIRWNMKIKAGENRYDALLNGVSLAPKNCVMRFRNQQVMHTSGFTEEPIMKFYYLLPNFVPIELQLLGGLVEDYICAKGYAAYKIGHTFTPNLSVAEQQARLGLCLYYAEHNDRLKFHEMMLSELTASDRMNYDKTHTFALEKMPNKSNHLQLRFLECNTPIYLLDNYVFESKTMHLSMSKF